MSGSKINRPSTLFCTTWLLISGSNTEVTFLLKIYQQRYERAFAQYQSPCCIILSCHRYPMCHHNFQMIPSWSNTEYIIVACSSLNFTMLHKQDLDLTTSAEIKSKELFTTRQANAMLTRILSTAPPGKPPAHESPSEKVKRIWDHQRETNRPGVIRMWRSLKLLHPGFPDRAYNLRCHSDKTFHDRRPVVGHSMPQCCFLPMNPCTTLGPALTTWFFLNITAGPVVLPTLILTFETSAGKTDICSTHSSSTFSPHIQCWESFQGGRKRP